MVKYSIRKPTRLRYYCLSKCKFQTITLLLFFRIYGDFSIAQRREDVNSYVLHLSGERDIISI